MTRRDTMRHLLAAQDTIDPITLAREQADTPDREQPREHAGTHDDRPKGEVNLMARLPTDLHERLTAALFNDGRRTIQSFVLGAVYGYLDDPDVREALRELMPRKGER